MGCMRSRQAARAPAATLALPTQSSAVNLLSDPSALVAGGACAGLAGAVSRLCTLAQGHWRHWVPGGAGRGGCVRPPANWPFAAIAALLNRGLLPLWLSALAARHAAMQAGAGAGAPPPAVCLRASGPVQHAAYALLLASMQALLRACVRSARAAPR